MRFQMSIIVTDKMHSLTFTAFFKGVQGEKFIHMLLLHRRQHSATVAKGTFLLKAFCTALCINSDLLDILLNFSAGCSSALKVIMRSFLEMLLPDNFSNTL